MIKLGETRIHFLNFRHHNYDCSVEMRVERENCSIVGRFIFWQNDSPLEILLALDKLETFNWKSSCENVIFKKVKDQGQTVYRLHFCIDAEVTDEYWEINICTAPEDAIEIDKTAISALFAAQ